MPGVSNSSPLIYLAALGNLAFLPKLFGAVTVPAAVWREVVVEGSGHPGAQELEVARTNWLSVADVTDPRCVAELVAKGLQVGESEAIVLAEESNERVIFMDDERGVRVARRRGFEVVPNAGGLPGREEKRLDRASPP